MLLYLICNNHGALVVVPSQLSQAATPRSLLLDWNPRPRELQIFIPKQPHMSFPISHLSFKIFKSLSSFLASDFALHLSAVSVELAARWWACGQSLIQTNHCNCTHYQKWVLYCTCWLEMPSSNLPEHSWATEQTIMDLRPTRLCPYTCYAVTSVTSCHELEIPTPIYHIISYIYISSQIIILQYFTNLDFPEIRGFPFLSYLLGWGRVRSQYMRVRNVFTIHHYSIPTSTTSNNSTLLPTTWIFTSPSARERGCCRDLALKLYQDQPRKSTVPNAEWTAQDLSQPSLLLVNAATKYHYVIPRCMESVSTRCLDTEMNGMSFVFGIHYPSSCTCPHSEMIRGFIRFPLLELVNFHEVPR